MTKYKTIRISEETFKDMSNYAMYGDMKEDIVKRLIKIADDCAKEHGGIEMARYKSNRLYSSE